MRINKSIKVLFNTSDASFNIYGGTEVQLLNTIKYLGKHSNLEIKLFDKWHDKLSNFDILHLFGRYPSGCELAVLAKKKGLKVIMTPIYWSPDSFLLHEKKYPSSLYYNLKKVTRKIWTLPFDYQKKIMDLSDILIVSSNGEKECIMKDFHIMDNKFVIVPVGVDKSFLSTDPHIFIEKYGFKDFVLFVGNIERRKNVFKLIQAMKYVKGELIIIGKGIGNNTYFEMCKQVAGNNVHFLGFFPNNSSILSSAYAASRLLVLPSWYETPGIVALEAGLAGTNILVTSGGCTREYFGDFVDYIDPSLSIKRFAQAIKISLNKKNDKKLQEHILRTYTWEIIKNKLVEIYFRLVKGKWR